MYGMKLRAAKGFTGISSCCGLSAASMQSVQSVAGCRKCSWALLREDGRTRSSVRSVVTGIAQRPRSFLKGGAILREQFVMKKTITEVRLMCISQILLFRCVLGFVLIQAYTNKPDFFANAIVA